MAGSPLNLVVATLPALIPWISFLYFRSVDYRNSISSSSFQKSYDYIIVGAGSAGCVLANRLSENPLVSVLLLEAGGSENLVSEIPQTIFHLFNTPLNWNFRSVPQQTCCFGIENRQARLSAGKALGGSSAINHMLYVRGNKYDFDQWASMGASGWSYQEVLPYFIRSEDNREIDIVRNGFHGQGGPLTVQRSSFRSVLAETFLQAGQLFGYQIVDYNGPRQMGIAIPQTTMRRNARCSASKAFLNPARGRPNLKVVTFAYVTKILFNLNKEAVGVVFDRFKKIYKVYARKEVIISAGSYKTSQLLMLSGIGPQEILTKFGIPVIANLPVGQNLIDHVFALGLNFLLDKSLKPINEFWTHFESRENTPIHVARYLTLGRGPIGSNLGMDGVAFVRTKFANQSFADKPDIQIILMAGCLSSDDGRTFRRVIGITDLMWDRVFAPFVQQECFTIFPILLQPKSRGYVTLKSVNPYDDPIINPRYFAHSIDLEVLTEGLIIAFEIATSEPFRKQYNVKASSFIVPGCEPYALYTRDYFKCLAQTFAISMWHQAGTCRMGNVDDPTTVVDPELRVKGVGRLRVVDGSVMPAQTSGNTNAPVIMIGEKGSDLIKNIRKTPAINLKSYLWYF